jgi:hypothetical protein
VDATADPIALSPTDYRTDTKCKHFGQPTVDLRLGQRPIVGDISRLSCSAFGLSSGMWVRSGAPKLGSEFGTSGYLCGHANRKPRVVPRSLAGPSEAAALHPSQGRAGVAQLESPRVSKFSIDPPGAIPAYRPTSRST